MPWEITRRGVLAIGEVNVFRGMIEFVGCDSFLPKVKENLRNVGRVRFQKGLDN
jgi:hypothetical protein